MIMTWIRIRFCRFGSGSNFIFQGVSIIRIRIKFNGSYSSGTNLSFALYKPRILPTLQRNGLVSLENENSHNFE